MKSIIKLEEMAMLAISIYALYFLQVKWWCYLILFLGPDISMLGYLAGNKMGAFCYNLFHHKAVGVTILFAGIFSGNWFVQVTGLILFGHSSMDRMFGYGLKYFEGFTFTHLGDIGKKMIA
jgi:Domain of unknown function (DUF4260)